MRRTVVSRIFLATLACCAASSCNRNDTVDTPTPPGFVLVMADDMGWGQTGYYNHPVLKTPNLDAMAATGMRFDRFYAGAPNCSPTRATVLTGRTHDRTGVEDHGFALRRQERTIARALNEVGYATGHFGKWHLNGFRGPGAPVLASDNHNPGVFGFQEWLSVTNFFERDPLMSRNGLFVQHSGDSSEVVVDEAMRFIGRQARQARPFLAVLWFGTPHSPWISSDEDRAAFADLDRNSQHHYGELVAMDRSIGTLRAGLRELGIEASTLVWFTSDNGGLPRIEPGTVGGLRGFKGSLYEGGIRVPAIIEWPDRIPDPLVSGFPAVTMDIFSTLAAIANIPDEALLQPQDGIDLLSILDGTEPRREKPIGFRHLGKSALIDNNLKIVSNDRQTGAYELYDLDGDPHETNDLARERPEDLARLSQSLEDWSASVTDSADGKDYLPGDFDPDENLRRSWMTHETYAPYINEWRNRPEFARYIEAAVNN
ncbi:MAG: sulfatase-like hydrolase/transferase [Bryobacterales bacterium]|nr:sulfatase-like hydrolase/transferase [Bryobacterales bacterium]